MSVNINILTIPILKLAVKLYLEIRLILPLKRKIQRPWSNPTHYEPVC